MPQCGEKADITIKGVRIVNHPSARLVRIADEHGDTYDMPPQAAITPAASPTSVAAAVLQERINSALRSIDHLTDEQTLDPWTAYGLRKRLDPNPRHWPPRAGDVWDDGMPFGGSLWFARNFRADEPGTPGGDRRVVVMVSVDGGTRVHSPDELLKSSDTLKLVYRHKDGGQ